MLTVIAIVWSASARSRPPSLSLSERSWVYSCGLNKYEICCSLCLTFIRYDVCFVITYTQKHKHDRAFKRRKEEKLKEKKRKEKRDNSTQTLIRTNKCRLIAFDIKWLHVTRINDDLLGIINGAYWLRIFYLFAPIHSRHFNLLALFSFSFRFLLPIAFYRSLLCIALLRIVCHASLPKMWYSHFIMPHKRHTIWIRFSIHSLTLCAR